MIQSADDLGIAVTTLGAGEDHQLEELAQMHIGSSEPAQAYTIQGCPAAGAVVGELAPHSDVVWIQGTQENGLCFALSSADFTVEELVKIAESVQKQ